MTDDRFERDVASVFAGMAPTHSPAELLDDVFLTTGRMRPRPQWLALIKEPPMRTSSRVAVGSPTFRLIAATAITLVLLLTSLAAVGIGARVLAVDQLPAPFGPARNGSLVYSAGGDIYLADADGSSPRAIVTGIPMDRGPWFSLEGTKMAFGRGSDGAMYLMVADADGSDVTRVAGPGGWWAEFLPGGQQMVFEQTTPDGPEQMSIIDATTGETVRVLDLGTVEPEWWVYPRPPEGNELVFRGHPGPGRTESGIYAIGVNGSGLRTVGELATNESDAQVSFLDPSISPDGSTIVYWNWEPDSLADAGSGTHMHLRDLSTGEELPVPFDTFGAKPLFSPDGASILFQRGIDDQLGQLNIVPADGRGPTVPVGPTFRYVDAYWYGFSPDGTQIYFVQAGKTTLIDIATGATTELTGSGGPEAGGWQRLAS